MFSKSRLLYLILAAAAAPLLAQAAPVYTVASVGNLGGSASQPNGINNQGQVVGYAYTPSNHINAFVSSNGTATSLHPAGDANASDSSAAGINDAGTAVGEIRYKNGTARAATFAGGAVQVLGTLGGDSSFGHAINASNQVAGRADLAGNNAYHAFLTQAGSLVDLGTLGGTNSSANGVNDLGAVTGYADIDANGDYRAFYYAGGTMLSLGTFGGNYSEGYAINNAGAVVGYAYLNGDSVFHAFLNANGIMLDLGSFGGDSLATDINEAGKVVGTAKDAGGANRAFLYSDGTLQDLNTLIDASLGWTLDYAGAINDSGQIAVHGCKNGNQCDSLLLTLADTNAGQDPNTVPEPEAFTAGIAALAIFGLLGRRKRPGGK